MKVALFCLATKLRFGSAVNARISASAAICMNCHDVSLARSLRPNTSSLSTQYLAIYRKIIVSLSYI